MHSSNNGQYCPKNTRCVYCKGSTERICCRGLDTGVDVPVFDTSNRPNGDGQISSVPQPRPSGAPIEAGSDDNDNEPTIAPEPTTERTTIRVTETERTTEQPQFTPESATLQYYSTTLTYTYIVWTRIDYFISTASSTITTTSTVFSVRATDYFQASNSLRREASSIQSKAIDSANSLRPTNTAIASAVSSPDVTVGVGGQVGGGGASAGSKAAVHVLSVLLVSMLAMIVLA